MKNSTTRPPTSRRARRSRYQHHHRVRHRRECRGRDPHHRHRYGHRRQPAPKVQGGQANMATVRPQQRPAQQPQQPSHSGLNYQKQALAEEHAMPRMRMPRTVGNFSDEERIVPTFLRDRDQLSKQATHNPGREEFIFEEEEIELPTFIRKQAN
ncbi:MAG: hypothetical protein ACLSAH_20285 [Bilophila wadsworthia]